MAQRTLPIVFGQTDYLQQLGTTGGSIRDYGCYVTTFSTLARACGKETDPVELNKILIEKGLYLNGNLMYDDNLTKVFPDLIYQQTIEFKNNQKNEPADIELLRSLMQDPTIWVIIKIKIAPPFNTHFVLCTSVNGVVKIADPLTKKIHDFSERYGDPATNIMKYVVYKGTPASNEAINESLRIDRDRNWLLGTEVISYLGLAITPDDIEGMKAGAKRKIDELKLDASEARREFEELKKKYEEEQAKVIDLNKANKEISSENQNSEEKAYDAEKLADKYKSVLKVVGDELEVRYNKDEDAKYLDEVLREVVELKRKGKEHDALTDALSEAEERISGETDQVEKKRFSFAFTRSLVSLLEIFFVKKI